MKTKAYTPEDPPKRGNALKAWRYLTRSNAWFPGREPKEMCYSPDCDGCGRRWLGYWGEASACTSYGGCAKPMYDSVGVSDLLYLKMDGDWDKELLEVARKAREEFDNERKGKGR